MEILWKLEKKRLTDGNYANFGWRSDTNNMYISATVRAMCGRKAVDGKTAEKQMNTLELKETVDGFATANEV